jgi:hypothetical protein
VNRHVIDTGPMHERASATPETVTRRKESLTPPVHREDAQGVDDGTLRGAQLWFARALMTPESEPATAGEREAGRRLTASSRLTALERLEIYRRAYHARLIECLADDYPVLEHALGTDAFDDLCRAFIARHPSEGPNLNAFGRRLASFCEREAPSPFSLRSFAASLAALEWAIVEVIHARGSEPLTLDGLRELPLEAWAEARLVATPALRLLRFEHPVNAYFQAYREGNDPTIPGAEPSATVVYRSGPTVWRMDLTVAMFDVLSSLVAGETLGASLGRAEHRLDGDDAEAAAQRVTRWFREWVSSGLFCGVELGRRLA